MNLACMGILLSPAGCTSPATKQPIAFSKYTNLKVGFSTVSFAGFMPVTKANSKKLIDFAAENGFSWIELRDPNAVLTPDECEGIAKYARRKNIKIGYGINAGLLDNDFRPKFNRAVQNASLFDGPKTVRVVACGKEFAKDPGKRGWTASELRRLAAYANRAAQIAERKGLHFVVENGTEALKGDGVTYFGLTEFFDRTNPNVGWQFDTANFFSGSRVRSKPADVEEFLQDHIDRLYYIHLKTSQDAQPQPVLGDNEFDFDRVFSMMSKHNISYVAIELAGITSFAQADTNIKMSLGYLRRKGFLRAE